MTLWIVQGCLIKGIFFIFNGNMKIRLIMNELMELMDLDKH
jgi:hypothetical protein